MTIKKLISTASAAALGLTLATTASAQDKIEIGAAVYGLNAEFMQLWADAAEKVLWARSHPEECKGIAQRGAAARLSL